MYRNLVMALAIATLIGQANPSRLSFEVATIKPSTELDDTVARPGFSWADASVPSISLPST